VNIVWGNPDGSVSHTAIPIGNRLIVTPDGPRRLEDVIGPVTDAKLQGLNIEWAETEDECASRVEQKLKQEFTDKVVIARTPPNLPRRLRNAWSHSNGSLTVDLPKARGILLKELRGVRDALLADSDKEQSKLNDIGTAQQKSKLKQYRQALRDLPATVTSQLEAITDPLQLATFLPVFPEKPE